jgi:hypothetical protein
MVLCLPEVKDGNLLCKKHTEIGLQRIEDVFGEAPNTAPEAGALPNDRQSACQPATASIKQWQFPCNQGLGRDTAITFTLNFAGQSIR